MIPILSYIRFFLKLPFKHHFTKHGETNEYNRSELTKFDGLKISHFRPWGISESILLVGFSCITLEPI